MSDAWVEATGASVDDAIDAVLDALDLDEDDAEIEVLPRPAGGQVTVRARPRADVVDVGDGTQDGDEFEEISDEELIESAQSFCDGLLESFDLEGQVETWIDEDGVLRVEMSGQNLGVLIGRKGRTLHAVAEIVRTAVLRQTGARTRLFVDIEGYRARRRDALAAYARRLAQRVAQSGVEIALEAMPAGDRKVIHDAVTDLAGAETFSEGEEPRRYVVISPATAGAPPSASGRRRTRVR